MAEFGWAYVSGQSPGGLTGSLQYKTGVGSISGSSELIFQTSSNTMILTGTMKVTGSSFVYGFEGVNAVGNSSTMSQDTTVAADYNSLLLGPITVGSGVSFTIESGADVKIIDLIDL